MRLTQFRIGIVIPTYNRREYVFEALESCFKSQQNITHCKIVVVDDGSTDGTSEFLRVHFNLKAHSQGVWQSDHFYLLEEKNSERGVARNRGAIFLRNLALEYRPNWYLFLDADDCLDPDALSGFQNFFNEKSEGKGDFTFGAICSQYILWNGKNFFRGPQPESFPGPEELRESVLEGSIMALGTSLISAQAFEEIGGFSSVREMSGSEDWNFLMKLAFSYRIYFIPQISVWYRRHLGNTSASQTWIAAKIAQDDLIIFFEQKKQQNISSVLSRLDASCHEMIIGAFSSSRQYRNVLNELFKYWTKSPKRLFRFKPWRLLAAACFGYLIRSRNKPA